VTSVGENEEKANTIQPPFLCFSHLQLVSRALTIHPASSMLDPAKPTCSSETKRIGMRHNVSVSST